MGMLTMDSRVTLNTTSSRATLSVHGKACVGLCDGGVVPEVGGRMGAVDTLAGFANYVLVRDWCVRGWRTAYRSPLIMLGSPIGPSIPWCSRFPA
jgi:hypothetical protein